LNPGVNPTEVVAGSGKKYWWKCRNVADHHWQAAVGHRTHRNTGCPYCDIAPRSRQEIRLAFELAYHLPVDHDLHKIKVGTKLWDVDICIPDERLIIEFDGSYWHREKGEKDKAKAQHLRRNGWIVVRVREAPLKKLSKWNVVVPTMAEPHVVATLLLEQLERVLPIEIARMDERRAADGPLCADEAEAYIEKLLAEKALAEE